MGERGKGAVAKPPEGPKNPVGRPRNKGPRPLIVRARKRGRSAIDFLWSTMCDTSEEIRYRLRAASELLRVATLDFEDGQGEALDEEQKALVVKFERNWRGTSTDGDKTGTEG